MEKNINELHKEVINTIEFIKQSYTKNSQEGDVVEAFRTGNCGNLCAFLLSEFPNKATPYGIYIKTQLHHIVTKIGDKYYDIGGEITIEKFISYLKDILPMAFQMGYISSNDKEYSIDLIDPAQVIKYSNNYSSIYKER